MSGQDVDFSFESKVRMAYAKKDVEDFAIAFNGKFLIQSLNIFQADQVKMLSDGNAVRGAIFTDGIDSFIIMPLLGFADQAKEDLAEAVQPDQPREEIYGSGAVRKAVRIYTNYIYWLLKTEAVVFVHRYEDRLSIRYIRNKGRDMIKGARIVRMDAVMEGKLIPAIDSLLREYNQKIINKIGQKLVA